MFIVKSLLLQDSSSQSEDLLHDPKRKQTNIEEDNMDIFGVAPATIPVSKAAQSTQAPPVTRPQVTSSATTAATSSATVKKDIPGFPSLVPAIVTKVNIGTARPLGQNYTGSSIVHFETPTGSIETVPGFSPSFKADVNFGADWLSFDADNKHARIDLRGVATDTEGHAIDFRYTGVLTLDAEVMKIFNQDPTMATIPFGYTTGHHTFLTANPRLKELEHCTFVSNSRITVTEAGLTVETRQSKVVPSTIMDFPSTVFG